MVLCDTDIFIELFKYTWNGLCWRIRRTIMLSVKGIYENGKVTLLEPIFSKRSAKVIVTLLDEAVETGNQKMKLNLFDDLVGVIDAREEGSTKHDQYINASAV